MIETRKISEANEQKLLRACLLGQDIFSEINDQIDEEFFFVREHKVIFQAYKEVFSGASELIDSNIKPLISHDIISLKKLDDLSTIDVVEDEISNIIKILKSKVEIRQLFKIKKFLSDQLESNEQSDTIFNQLNDMIIQMGNEQGDQMESLSKILHKAIPDPKNPPRITSKLLGVPTGLDSLDKITKGYEKKHINIIAARTSSGKALSLDSKLLTQNGFIKMSQIKVADLICGSDGHFYPVTGVYPQGYKKCYNVIFNDKTRVCCTDDHLWLTQNRNERRYKLPASIKKLSEIKKEIICNGKNKYKNHTIEYVSPIDFNQEVILDPYLLGILIGDGNFTKNIIIFNSEKDIIKLVKQLLPHEDCLTTISSKNRSISYRIKRKIWTSEASETSTIIKNLNLYGCRSYEKFIPKNYLFSSIDNRIDLLQGLIDSDGYVTPNSSSIEYSTTSKKLMRDIIFLVRSLGGRATCTQRDGVYVKQGKHINTRINYRITISFPNGLVIPINSKKHLKKFVYKGRTTKKSIIDIEDAGMKECQCISVDSPDNLFITDGFNLTHNTVLAYQSALATAMEGGRVLIYTLEDSKTSVADRLLSTAGDISNYKVIYRNFKEARDKVKFVHTYEELEKLPIHIDENVNHSAFSIFNSIRKKQIKYGEISLVILDYIQCMSHDFEQITTITRQFQNYVKTLDIALVIVSQFNRGLEFNKSNWLTPPRPSNLRGSGALEEYAHKLIFITINESEEEEIDTPIKEAMIWVIKNKGGPKGKLKVNLHGEFFKFKEEAFSISQPESENNLFEEPN